MIKVLNLYAGIGGNRKLWENVEVTAVEYKQEIADIYKHFFPQDKVVVADAHQYLEEHFEEFDFIWSSPPCPSHSRVRKFSAVARGQNKPIFPNMKLYEEILFLQGYFKGKWVVENVVSWYDPLIKPFESGSHYFWSNFIIPKLEDGSREHDSTNKVLEKKKGFDLSGFKNLQTDKKLLLRNCVEPNVGKDIFDAAFKHEQSKLF
jgi:DNA (cytosine-5)-methyltransferase 1